MLLVLGMMTRRRRSGRQQRAMDRLDQQQNAIFSDEEVGLMPHEISARRNRPHDPPVERAFDSVNIGPTPTTGPLSQKADCLRVDDGAVGALWSTMARLAG